MQEAERYWASTVVHALKGPPAEDIMPNHARLLMLELNSVARELRKENLFQLRRMMPASAAIANDVKKHLETLANKCKACTKKH